MGTQYPPLIGEWYQTAVGDTFEVVAYDVDEQTIEIQYFDGAIEELDLETWQELPLALTEPPEDWSGSMDVMREDFGLEQELPSMHDGYSFLDDLDGLS